MKRKLPIGHRSWFATLPLLYRMLRESAQLRQANSEEKGVCLTVSDLVVLGYPHPVVASLESIEVLEDQGFVTVTYSYKEPWTAERAALLLHTRVQIAPSEERSLETYSKLAARLAAGAWLDGVQRLEPAKLARSESVGLLSLLVKNAKPVGNEFVFQHKATLLCGTMLGPHFDDVNEWFDLLSAKAQKASRAFTARGVTA
jgi:hypothetical protein